MCEKVVIAVKKSQNSKTGPVSVTYAPIQSCPKTCPFLDSGCYAQHGHSGIHLSRINKNAKAQKKTRPIDIAREEAKAIRNLDSDRPLRLHIVGDCKTPKAAETVARACKEYSERTGERVWTYTHAWKDIPRSKWGNISVLASCETIKDAKYAMERGYAASMVRGKEFSKPFDFEGVTMVPCLEMTNGIACDKCKICMHDDKLLNSKKVICFFPHGTGSNKVKETVFQSSANAGERLSDGRSHIEDFKKTIDDGSFMQGGF